MGSLEGRVALVTGAGQGVGQGIALALAAEGADVAVLGRTPAKLEATCELLRERGVRAEAFAFDVADTAGVPEVVAAVADRFGRIDILVNNAYTGAFGPLLELSDEQFQRGFVSGPFATMAMMRACHPHLAASGNGHIVNLVTSAMVRWDPSTYGSYAAAKQAVRSLTRTAAVEWARDGIRANCIAPHALSPGPEGLDRGVPRGGGGVHGDHPRRSHRRLRGRHRPRRRGAGRRRPALPHRRHPAAGRWAGLLRLSDGRGAGRAPC